MNQLSHIPLDEMLLMSFKASDDGDNKLAEEFYKSFEKAKDKALKLAEKAVEVGDTKTVDVIIKSFEKAKVVSQERIKQNTATSIVSQNGINSVVETNEVKSTNTNNEVEDFNDLSINNLFSEKLQNISDNENLSEQEKIDDLAKNILSQFQELNSDNINKEKEKEKEINKQSKNSKISKDKRKSNIDTLLKKYLAEGKFEIGEKRAKKLLIKNPKSAYLHNYLGVCLAQQKKFEKSLKCFEDSIKIDPKADDTLFNKSIVKLRLGDFKEGWDLYSHGLTKENNIREIDNKYFNDKTQLWDGVPFNGGLLVYGEQGIGDQLMFGIILEDLLKIQKKVVIIVDDRLKKLFRRTYPEISVHGFSENEIISPYSKHISMGGLCKFFRNSADKFNNGTFREYITSFEIDKQIKTLMPSINGLKIGVSWLTFAKKNAKTRSLTSEQLACIMNSNSHNFINLQYGEINKNLEELNKISNKKLQSIPGVDVTYNIESLASIIKNCDLIITIDNSTAHLAASLGKPVWVLLPYNNDFRWMEKSEESLWYKNVLLLRQNKKDDWSQVINNINSALDQ